MRFLFLLLLLSGLFISKAQKVNHLSYDELTSRINELHQKHPESLRLTIAQEQFNLPSPGVCGEHQVPCTTQILHITNFSTYEEEKETRPELYISGELHGDERVGPYTCLEVAKLLLESDNIWIRHLFNTRSIFLTPITNSLGFHQNKREEGPIDPNRDYPIDQDQNSCMKAIASRIANELYREHMFQLAITFHGGMEAIALEWGTMSRHRRDLHKSPDDFAFLQIGGGLARFSGPVTKNGKNYPVGRMNDLVYPVPGGMEDWAYAGNWDPLSKRSPCQPDTFGGYPTSKTEYTDDMLRAINILVETSDDKWPRDLGTMDDVLNPKSGNGHVARNVRLVLMLMDLVQPYIRYTSIVMKGRKLSIKWEVGGAFEVDETQTFIYSSDGKFLLAESEKLKGKTRWSTGSYDNRGKYPFRTQFTSCFTFDENFSLESKIRIRTKAKVDGAWAKSESDANPAGFSPQSHLVNARTNLNWKKMNGGKKIQGRIEWFDENKVILSLNEDKENIAPNQGGKRLLRNVQENDEEDDDTNKNLVCVKVTSGSLTPDNGSINKTKEGPSFISLFFLVFCLFAFLMFAYIMYKTRYGHHKFVPIKIQDETG